MIFVMPITDWAKVQDELGPKGPQTPQQDLYHMSKLKKNNGFIWIQPKMSLGVSGPLFRYISCADDDRMK